MNLFLEQRIPIFQCLSFSTYLKEVVGAISFSKGPTNKLNISDYDKIKTSPQVPVEVQRDTCPSGLGPRGCSFSHFFGSSLLESTRLAVCPSFGCWSLLTSIVHRVLFPPIRWYYPRYPVVTQTHSDLFSRTVSLAETITGRTIATSGKSLHPLSRES